VAVRVIDLEQRFESAIDITEDDAREWSRQLGTAKRKARTVNDVWINAARTVFAWAERERLVGSNPFKGLKVTQPRWV
jgi:site-specific recombinase XerD